MAISRSINYVLVTGATGFIGAHVVDLLLSRGLRVRGATRSMAKGNLMIDARLKYGDRLDFVEVDDFEKPGRLHEAVKGVDAVIHVASPLCYQTENSEKELIIPAIQGVKGILEAAADSNVARVVMTSSFASVMDANRESSQYFTYTGDDWNPLTYEEAADPATPAYLAYRGAKKFAEKAAWDFVTDKKPGFDFVTLCPSMTFGPVVHPVSDLDKLNESSAMLWKVAKGEPLATARVPSWIDVRDLAQAHVEAALRPSAGGKRYIVGGDERFTYDLAAQIIEENFDWAKGNVHREQQRADDSYGIDGQTAAKELGLSYTPFQKTVIDTISQLSKMERNLAS